MVEDLRGDGLIARRGALHPHGAVLPPLRRAGGAAHLAPVVLRHDPPGGAGDRGGRARAGALHARRSGARSTSTGCARSGPWCVSRQLWWGHQIPVWYRGDEIYVGRPSPGGRGLGARPRRPRHLVQLRAVAVRHARLARADARAERFYPTTVLSTARDIIFLWVARMVMMGLEFMGEEPFTDVYIHSVIQAPDGRRMSKSLGTGIDPMEVDRAARRRRPALRPADDVEHPGRALHRRPHRPGPPARHQALERRPARLSTAAAAPAAPRPRPGPSPTAGSLRASPGPWTRRRP